MSGLGVVRFSGSKSLDQNQGDSFGNWLISNLVSRGKQLNMRKEIHLVRVCKCGNIRPIKIGMTRDLSLQLEWEAGNSRARFSQQQKMYPQQHNTPHVRVALKPKKCPFIFSQPIFNLGAVKKMGSVDSICCTDTSLAAALCTATICKLCKLWNWKRVRILRRRCALEFSNCPVAVRPIVPAKAIPIQ